MAHLSMRQGMMVQRTAALAMRSSVSLNKSMACGQMHSDASRTSFTNLKLSDYELPEDVTSKLLTPSLIVYKSKIKHNIETVLGFMGNNPNRWRPHIKTTKATAMFEQLVHAGIENYKCATPKEALVLGNNLKKTLGKGDILLSFPVVGPNLERAGEVASEIFPVKLSVLVESASDVPNIPTSISGVFADVNPGMDRSGMPLKAAEDGELDALARAAGDRFKGIHFYDGHAVSFADGAERQDSMGSGYDRAINLFDKLSSMSLEPQEIITSGSHSISMCINHPGLSALEARTEGRAIHRASPGTVVLHDLNSDLGSTELKQLQPAALVATRVVSAPNPDKGIITLDCGSKSIACEAGHPVGFVLGHPELQPLGPSEEHLPTEAPLDSTIKRGDLMLMIPRHVCPTVNLAEQALMLDENRNAVVIDIEARSHELLLSEKN